MRRVRTGRCRRLRAFAAALTAVGVLATPASAATTLTFENNAYPFQDDFLGVNAVYMGFTGMPEATGMTPALRTVEHQRAADSGIKIARSWYGIDWALPNYPSTAGGYQWTSARMNAFYDWLQAMKSRGVDVAINIGWTFTTDVCSTNNAGCTPTASDLATFAHWASDSLHQLVNVKGFTNVKYAVLFTEANVVYAGNVPSGHTPSSYYAHIANTVAAQIASDDASRPAIRPQVKIVGPQETTQLGSGNNDLTEYVRANAASAFDIYSTHRYCMFPEWSPGGYQRNDCPEFAGWKTVFDQYVSDVAPHPLWSDEVGAVPTSVHDEPYRNSGDYGTLLANMVAAQMNAGVQSTFAWMLQDQRFVYPNATLFQHYGLARWLGDSADVRPAWYAHALAANLLGGGANASGTGTYVFRTTGGTANINGVSVLVPNGVGGCAIATGCAAMMVVNRENTAQSVSFGFRLNQPAPGATFYRYVYNSGNTPRPYADDPGHVPTWDDRYGNVTTGIPANVVPANSVAIYSQIDRGAPDANESPSATATASSGSSAALVNDRDATELAGAGWTPDTAASGPQHVDLTWSGARTIDRLELDFAASAPPASYTVQYWNGSTWTAFSPAVDVTANDQAHRTHTFAAVTTTRLRFAIPGPASPGVNEIQAFRDGSRPDTALGFSARTDGGTANKYDYERIDGAAYTLQPGDTIEYDVKLLDRLGGLGGLDADVADACSGNLRSATGWADQHSIGGHPGSDISARAYNTWYHRVLPAPPCAIGHAASNWTIASEHDTDGYEATAFYDNIVVKRSDGSTALTVYHDGAPATIRNVLREHTPGHDVFVLPRTPG